MKKRCLILTLIQDHDRVNLVYRDWFSFQQVGVLQIIIFIN
ncbi:uncharacterized protein J3R85_000067 [Psidium guajava]|nr:uncharacterized protein J3R85_000067 [Psidium guajava]